MTPLTGSLLLNTNAAIASINSTPEIAVVLSTAVTYVPFIVLAELYFGAFRSSRVEDNLRNVQAYSAKNSILYPDELTTREYGNLRQGRKTKGHPIPGNDIWIAAIALRHGLPVLTRDQHFNEVDELAVLTW